METKTPIPLHTNRLINETSPYLLQHAHNPVEWYPYGNDAFEAAAAHHKPMLFSIGYSSCHWCHVMERESFENEEIATLMNQYFICVKVDREEHPDVDHAYMDAVHLLHGQGGWPLNCFALPDGRPFWGATYFRPEQWRHLLDQVHNLFENHYSELEVQANNIANGFAGMQASLMQIDVTETAVDFAEIFRKLNQLFDHEKGGFAGAPKFPMPVVLDFLLKHSCYASSEDMLHLVELTIDSMSRGGIYDQAGGGFARYSTDADWKVPHFEKMLYDNALLISLLSDLFKYTGKKEYRLLIDHTLNFIQRELTSTDGMFYSAIDADSEGMEGFYYTYTKEEFWQALGSYAQLMGEYFGIDKQGLWENGRNILLRPHVDKAFAQQHFLSETELQSLSAFCCTRLLNLRSSRIPPTLDNKQLLSWNALMIEAMLEAYAATRNKDYLAAADKASKFIIRVMLKPDGGFYHTFTSGKAMINAFLDDYAFIARAFLKMYSITMETEWLNHAEMIVEYAVKHFYDEQSGFFWFSEPSDNHLFARKIEIYDGVIPSANSAMCGVLNLLDELIYKPEWRSVATGMLRKMKTNVSRNPASYAGWASLMLSSDFRMVTVVGKKAKAILQQLHAEYLPGTYICGCENGIEIHAFDGKFVAGKTLIHICTHNTCLPPVETVDAALRILRNYGETGLTG